MVRPVRWISLGDLLFQRLFGRLGTSLSMASGTGLLQLDGMRWDDELLDVLGVPETSLPPIAESVRALLPRHRRAWPALADVPWFHALGDGALANLGSGCTVPSRRAVTIGTSAAMRVMQPSGAGSAVPQGLWRYRLDGSRLVTGGALSSGGNLREWLESTLRVGGPGLESLQALRDRVFREPLARSLTWPFVPHVTVADEMAPDRIEAAVFETLFHSGERPDIGGRRLRVQPYGTSGRHAGGDAREFAARKFCHN